MCTVLTPFCYGSFGYWAVCTVNPEVLVNLLNLKIRHRITYFPVFLCYILIGTICRGADCFR